MVLANAFAPWFRTEFQKDGNLSILKKKLDESEQKIVNGEDLTRKIFRSELPISISDFEDAKILYTNLLPRNDYKIRVERYTNFCIYSNDKDFLLDLAFKTKISSREFWEPNSNTIDTLLNEKNIILVDSEPELELKVTLNSKKLDTRFANWLKANTDKSRVGNIALSNIESGYGYNNYFYIRDEKVLYMLNLIIGNNIQRVEKLVYRKNI